MIKLITKIICMTLIMSFCNEKIQAQLNYAPQSTVLFDNGPMVTHPEAGIGGADVSACNAEQVVVGTYCNAANSAYVADDFTLTSPSNIESIDFYAFQDQSGTTSTITGVYIQIWKGAPNAGGTVIWGDLKTNRLASTFFANIYRTNPRNFAAYDRPIMSVTANIGLELNPGTYWIQVGFTGSNANGPYANPVTVLNEPANGNSITYTGTIWKANLDFTSGQGSGAQFAIPFIIKGDVMPGCSAIKSLASPVIGTQAFLSWAAPDQTPVEYHIYQNGAKIASVPVTKKTWTSEKLTAGTHTFGVAAVYNSNCIPMQVNTEPLTIKTCPEASNISVTFDSEKKALVSWNAPTEPWDKILWDNTDINISGYGLPVAHWTTDDLYIYCADDFTAHEAWIIEKISAQGFFGTSSMKTTKFGITIYKDDAGKPGVELYTNKNITAENAPFGTIWLTLPKAYTLQPGKYWIAIYGVFPIPSPTSSSSARWNAFYGDKTIGDHNMMMKDPNEYMGKGTEWINISDQMTAGAISLSFSIKGKPLNTPVTKYNVYLDGVKIADQISDNSFYHNLAVDTVQKHSWCVTVSCPEGGESDLVCLDGLLATSEPNVNNISVFPNPASNQILITGVQATQVDVCDIKGQVIDCIKGNPVTKVDVSDYNNGTYILRIYTGDKNYITKAVVIVH